MVTVFPTPVLSIASEAVKDLEGRDALLGLWTLFTKCKESLQDGRRLENISWRLWYREMKRDGSKNRLYQGDVNEKEQDQALKPHGSHTPTNPYRPPTPSESSSPPPPYLANGLIDLTLSTRPTALPQDHDHSTSSPTSRLGSTQVDTYRSNSSAVPALCPPLDSASASLQMSKSKLNSDTVLPPVVPVHPLSLSSSPSGSQSHDFADIPTNASSVQPIQRPLDGFPAQIQCGAGSNTPAPVRVGRIICDMLPCSASDETSWLKVGPSSITTTTRKITSLESMPVPVVDSSSSLQPPVVPTISTALPPPNSIELTSATNAGTTNSKYSSLNTAPPSPSLSDSYALAHPGEVEVLDVTQLNVAVGPSPSHHPAPHHHQQLKSEKPPERQIIPGEVAERQLQKQGKEKGRERSNSKPNTKPKQPTHETLNMVSSALAAKVKHTLADPLLPGQHKRTIVLTTSESEDEHSDDDESCWSSEEMESEDEKEGWRKEQQRQDRMLAQQQLQQLQQRHQRPSPAQRTHSSPHTSSSNQPLTTNHHHNRTHAANGTHRSRTSRGHRHPPNQGPQAPQGQTLAQAALEAQRQLDMFTKKPTESFQNLTQVARTQSVGLLTQLLNPNPEIFPVGHPYRRGNSSSEIRGVGGHATAGKGDRDRDRGFKPLQPLIDVKATKTDATQDKKLDTRPPPPSRPETTVPRKLSSPSVHSRATVAFSPPARTLSMQRTKSAAAVPVSSPVQTGSMSHTSNVVEGGGHRPVNGFGMTNMKMTISSNHSSGGYRPKGRPQDQELEDESGSEVDGIQVSKSVAQEKLKALAERRGIVTHENQSTTTTKGGGADTEQKDQLGDEGDVPHWAKVSEPRPPTRTRSHTAKVSKPRPPTRTRSHDQYPQSQAPVPNANRRSLNAFQFNQIMTSNPSHPTPIPFGHPYNLPLPAPPSTPRTTRRLMLSTELSESLRRNLLWERQVSKVNLAAAVRRTASSGGSRPSPLGGVQPLQPLTTAPSMVQLLPKGTLAYPNPGSPGGPVGPVRSEQGSSEGDSSIKKERRASGGAGDHPGPSVHDEKEREQKRRLAMARNRSWANDYHFAGW